MAKSNFKLEAPWYTFRKKVASLFEQDPDIIVGQVYDIDDRFDYAFDIEVRNHEKFIALDRVLPKSKTYGNINLGIYLFDEENEDVCDDSVELFKTIFEGNPIVRDIKELDDQTGTHHGYVRFQPEVIQFYDDNLFDYDGNWSGLAQDIAVEVFAERARGVHFCTADARKNGTKEDGEE